VRVGTKCGVVEDCRTRVISNHNLTLKMRQPHQRQPYYGLNVSVPTLKIIPTSPLFWRSANLTRTGKTEDVTLPPTAQWHVTVMITIRDMVRVTAAKSLSKPCQDAGTPEQHCRCRAIDARSNSSGVSRHLSTLINARTCLLTYILTWNKKIQTITIFMVKYIIYSVTPLYYNITVGLHVNNALWFNTDCDVILTVFI